MPVYALTIFTGAFLLFQVQPLIGKYILPWFGGGPGVWTTCMLFFQVLLLGGYAYAHLLSRLGRARWQAVVHVGLLLAALAFLPVIPAETWKPGPDTDPALRILLLLTVTLGLPYLVLASTGPLMQHWFSRTHPGVPPYRLYALSNVGSLLALVSYPFFFETHFSRQAQAALWGGGLALYVVFAAVCAVKLWRTNPACPNPAPVAASGPETHPLLLRFLWLALPCCGSVLLLAVTNKLCQDVAVFPFLWVLPLSVYLLTFIIAFDSPRWYVRLPFTVLLIAAVVLFCQALEDGGNWALWRQAGVYGGGLFVCCMVCHGELFRLRPEPARLTSYYLLIAAGGALGGAFVALAAPALFTDYYELHWALLACCGLLLLICLAETTGDLRSHGVAEAEWQWKWLGWVLPVLGAAGLDRWIAAFPARHELVSKWPTLLMRGGVWLLLLLGALAWLARRRKTASPQPWRILVCAWLSIGLAALAVVLWFQARSVDPEIVHKSRNFYGVLTVYERRKEEPTGHHYVLQHGRITHGLQFADPELAKRPTSYYAETSGIGLAMNAFVPPRKVGVVGLGTGTLSAYGKVGDSFRIYEINPQVLSLAKTPFSYLALSPAQVEVALGDARLSMEREAPQGFDVIALDAFSSDAIPVHLLTREAFALYDRHLRQGGIIAVHISNHYLDLEPVVRNLARAFDYGMAIVDYDETDEDWWFYSSTWILLSRDRVLLEADAIQGYTVAASAHAPAIPLWTDDFTSIFQILK